MPEYSMKQMVDDAYKKIVRDRAKKTLRTFMPLAVTRTPVIKPSDHQSATRMRKLGQGLSSINKVKKTRFR